MAIILLALPPSNEPARQHDTYLRLYNFLNKQVATSDDGVCTLGTGSLITYTSPYAPTASSDFSVWDFTIWGGCYGNETCGPNTVRLARKDPEAITFNVKNTNNATTGTVDKSYYLYSGDSIFVSTCSYAAYGAKATGNTYLRLYQMVGGSWSQIKSNDNAASSLCAGQCDTASYIAHTVVADAEYMVRVGCSQNEACSGTAVLYRVE